jgi:hypothetical protein
MALLDQLIAQYGNSSQNPYAKPQAPMVQPTASSPSVQVPISSLIDMLGRDPSVNPYASMGGQSQGLDANPQILQISPDEAAAAQAQQGGGAAPAQAQIDPARVAAMQAQAAQQQATALQAAPGQAAQQPQAPQMSTQQVTPPTVASVNAAPGFPSPSDYNADGTQADQSAQSSDGGLLGALAGAGQQAASDPVAAKGLLSQLGDTASTIGTKLKSLSPAASQALIASGLTMLAGNDGQHNLAQLVGQGGIAGINQYQTITQNAIGNQLARQKLAQDLAEKQATNQTANYNAATERFKATNQPTQVEPGNSIVTPGMIAGGQGPLSVTGPNGALPAKTTREVQGPDGTMYTQGYDMWGRPVGGPTVKSAPYTGELSADNQKIVNSYADKANESALSLTKTQNFLKQLTPTIPDPNNPGQMIKNPDYVPVTGGVAATVQNELNRITGGQTQSQLLRSQIQQNVYQAQLGMWKPGIGGRLTNTDVNLLKQGMPPDNASGSTLANYLNAYAHLQEDQATHAALTRDFVTANRGDMSALHKDSVIGGITYPAGTTMQQVLSKQAPVQSNQSQNHPAVQQAQGIIAQAQAAARSGDAQAQAALKQRGLSW